jgi:hypothetical protein
MSKARFLSFAATGLDGKVYVFGGASSSSGTIENSAEAFDPSTNSWSPIADMGKAYYASAAVTLPDGRIFLLGGIDSTFVATSDTRAYDPVLDTYSAMANLPKSGGAIPLP